MKRAIIIGVLIGVAGLSGVSAMYGRELIDGIPFERAMGDIGRADEANAGRWPQKQETCFFCHGARGQSLNSWYPSLAGQPEAYVIEQLHAFADDRRRNPYMGPLARSLTDDQTEAMAAYFARQTPARNEAVQPDPALRQRGLALIRAGTCQACHGMALMGKDKTPRLAGQGEGYLANQLTAFKTGQRLNPTGPMNGIAAMLSADDIRALANYIASLSPGGRADGTS
jgi:cytochrome c553